MVKGGEIGDFGRHPSAASLRLSQAPKLITQAARAGLSGQGGGLEGVAYESGWASGAAGRMRC